MHTSLSTSYEIALRAREFLRDGPCRLQVAALPWRTRKGAVEVLLVTSRDTGRWVLPKGWPENGEELSEAAAREAVEEAGIRGRIAEEPAGRFFYDKIRASGDNLKCEVLVFPLLVTEKVSKWREKGQRKQKWAGGVAAAAMVAEPDLGALIARFCAAGADKADE